MTTIRKKQSGFVILYAVLVAGVISIGGILLANIIVKQLMLSSVGKESRLAYYAANAGDECARFGNAQYAFGGFQVDLNDDLVYEQGDIGLLTCGTAVSGPTDVAPGVRGFEFEVESVGGNQGAIVRALLSESNPLVVEATGYNIKDLNHPRRVEIVIVRSSSSGD